MNYSYTVILFSLVILITLYISKKELFVNVYNFKLDKIYIINLKKNKDRWDAISKAAKNANVPITRFNAIYEKELPPNHPDIKKYFATNHELSPRQIGCALSHIKIWEDAVKNNYENILIFEDDVIIPPDFLAKLEPVVNELPDDWNMLLLGLNNIKATKYSKHLIKPHNKDGNWEMHAYIINLNMAKYILRKILYENIRNPIDVYFNKYIYTTCNTFIAYFQLYIKIGNLFLISGVVFKIKRLLTI